MNRELLSPFIAFLLFAGTSLAAKPDPADDAKAVQGLWIPVKAELAGQPMPDSVLKTISLKLDKGKYEVTVSTEPHPDKGLYIIDATSKPKSVTITSVEGPNHGKTIPAIYELEGDTYRVCYDLSCAKRPTEFKTLPGTQLYLVTYKRKKD